MSAISLFFSVATVLLRDRVTHDREWVEVERRSNKREREG